MSKSPCQALRIVGEEASRKVAAESTEVKLSVSDRNHGRGSATRFSSFRCRVAPGFTFPALRTGGHANSTPTHPGRPIALKRRTGDPAGGRALCRRRGSSGWLG